MEDKSCKTSRWRFLKAQLNNLLPEEFWQAILHSTSSIIIDVRTPAEFAAGHLPDAININYFGESFWKDITALPEEAEYFIYCRSGRRSIRTATLMRNGGFDNHRVFNMEGGWNEWKSRKLPVTAVENHLPSS